LQRVLTKLRLTGNRSSSGGQENSRKRIPLEVEKLGLRPGEYVEVKSEEEIRATLDQDGGHRGLVLIPEMFEYCGKRLKVYKRVERIILRSQTDEEYGPARRGDL
jgi:hypothetical protein